GNLPDFNVTASSTTGQTSSNTVSVNPADTDTNDAPDAIDDTYLTPNINGLVGEYFVYNEGSNADGANLTSLSMVNSFIDGRDPDATFVSTSINYGGVSNNLGSDGALQTFLGDDAASLNTDPANSSDAIIKLSGSLNLEANTTYYFRITSDDGFSLSINGEIISEFTTNRGPGISTGEFTTQNAGEYDLGIVYWDQAGQAVLKVEVSTDGTNYNVLSTDNLLLPINNTLITDEDTPLVIVPETLLSNDTDSEGDALTITGVSDAQHGSVVLNNDGTITFTPEENYSGEATFVYTITDSNGGIDTATVSILVNPVNDAPVVANATANLYVPVDDIRIANLAAGFSNAVFESNANSTSRNNDADTFQDAYYWGNYNSIKYKSGYILVDNSDYKNGGSEISTDSFVNFGTFTHQNLPIQNGTLKTINMDINFDVIINGTSQNVSFTIAMNHTETPNSGSDPRDIITLPSETYTFELNGQEYIASIAGFQDANGNIVQTIYTDENASNSYTVVGKIVSAEDSLPTVTGSVIANDAEDENLTIVWGDTQSDYGTLIANDDGTYSFEVNRETKDSISSGETLTETFTYSVTDSNGVTSSSTLTINIGGYDTVYSSTNNFVGDSGNNYLTGSDGSADILNGGAGNDVLVYDNEDTIDGGDNEDILLIQEDITLDFDSVSANISNIEIIDLGTGSQNITISAEDVLDITGSNVLEILGDSSDSVTLSGTWTSTGVVDGFNIYTSNDTGSQVTIKIEEDINNITVS
ncbi:MAG: large repetitive protein, partial [Sulfurospirillum sp.]|nr:large repetitive protein [Sulfurospirillum sp.]